MELQKRITGLAIIVFEENQRMSLSGLGILKHNFLNAYYSDTESVIIPPKKQVYFRKNIHAPVDSYLLHKVKALFSCSDIEAETQIIEWQNQWLDNIEESPFVFGEFGYFVNDKGIKFIEYPVNFYTYLPEVKTEYKKEVLPQLPFEREENIAFVRPSQPSKNKISSSTVLWSVFVVLFGISIYFWRVPIIQAFVSNKDLSLRIVNIAPENYSYDKEINNFYSDTAADFTQVNMENKKVDQSNTIITNQSDLETLSTDRSVVANEEKPCTMIVGAFANDDNVKTMVAKLNQFQYESVVFKENNLTLVGAKISCGNDSEEEDIQKNIEAGAWLYNN
ncbi:hypothetical protein [Membranihabitans marinus]|uniref:hypothetical protein n=1 Tax=Membranihabitans marinus TaxID=1227546 RepID=UPI001F3D8ED4|nr:hypothetical protein [Membranihabitans marinus]